jgi:hypothetical protein
MTTIQIAGAGDAPNWLNKYNVTYICEEEIYENLGGPYQIINVQGDENELRKILKIYFHNIYSDGSFNNAQIKELINRTLNGELIIDL